MLFPVSFSDMGTQMRGREDRTTWKPYREEALRGAVTGGARQEGGRQVPPPRVGASQETTWHRL
ncbi:hypothetical protein GCM10017687_59620 [Streptomyces echinatus]